MSETTTLKTRFGDLRVQKEIMKGNFDNIPIIDLSNLRSPLLDERRELAKRVYDACTNVGFFYVKNHGISWDLISDVHDAAKRFFALPDEVKMETFIGKSERFRGFSPLYGEHGDKDIYDQETGSLSEAFDIGYEIAADPRKDPSTDVLPPDTFGLYGGNLWPKDDLLPGANFKETYLRYFGEVLELSRALLKIFALALDLSEDYFDSIVKTPGCISRMLHYPPQPVPGEKKVGIEAHTDFECFTILSQEEVPALQVLNAHNQWVEAPPIPGTFVVNIGDFFTFWTNGIFRSTLHRAINLTGKERYSIPFFFGVDYDAGVSVLSNCVAASPKQPGKVISAHIKAGEYVRKRLANTYVGFGEEAPGKNGPLGVPA